MLSVAFSGVLSAEFSVMDVSSGSLDFWRIAADWIVRFSRIILGKLAMGILALFCWGYGHNLLRGLDRMSKAQLFAREESENCSQPVPRTSGRVGQSETRREGRRVGHGKQQILRCAKDDRQRGKGEKQILRCAKDDRRRGHDLRKGKDNKNRSRSSAARRMTDRGARLRKGKDNKNRSRSSVARRMTDQRGTTRARAKTTKTEADPPLREG